MQHHKKLITNSESTKIDQERIFKIKMFYKAKPTKSRVKTQTSRGNLAIYITDMGRIFQIFKQIPQINLESKLTTQVKYGQNILIVSSQKRKYRWLLSLGKDV